MKHLYWSLRRCARYLRNYFVQKVVQKEFSGLVHKVDYTYERAGVPKVWIVWWQGKDTMPMLVKNCYQSVVENNPDMEVVVIDQNNFQEYVQLPDFVISKLNSGNITLTHMSDILRFALLSQWGGWYLDSTLFLFSHLPRTEDLFTIKHSQTFYDVHSGVWTGFFWYMPKGHPLAVFMNKALNAYWETHDKLIAYFLVDHLLRLYYDKQPLFRSYIDALSINNQDLYFFRGPKAFEPYDQEEWNRIVSKTFIFKFNRKIRPIPSRKDIPDGTYMAWLVDNCFKEWN